MRDVVRDRRKRASGTLRAAVGVGAASQRRPSVEKSRFHTTAFQKPREWRFQTRPLFKKVKGPLVDVFEEAQEVLIVIDLGAFARGDVSLSMTLEKYTVDAQRGDQHFHEEIALPQEVDIERCQEHFRNGVLEIILPRRRHLTKETQTTERRRR